MSSSCDNGFIGCPSSNCPRDKLARLGLVRNKPGIYLWCKNCHREIGFTFAELLARFETDDYIEEKASELSRRF